MESNSRLKQNQGKLDRKVFEEDNRKYIESITSKPKLFIEIAALNKPHCYLSVRNLIVLFIYEHYGLAEWVDLNIIIVKRQLYGIHNAAKNEEKEIEKKKFNTATPNKSSEINTGETDEVVNQSNCDSSEWSDGEEENVLVKYESEVVFDEGNLLKDYENKRRSNIQTVEEPDIRCCKRPSVVVREKRLIISGLSSVLRFLLKFSSMKVGMSMRVERNKTDLLRQQQLQGLLGFRAGCLQACAETSIWTKFCEVDMIRVVVRTLVKAANSTLNLKSQSESKATSKEEIPKDLIRFEYHLNQPVRIHNFRKRVQAENQKLQKQVTGNSNKEQVSQLSHNFAEGPDMTLSDVMLYPCVHLAIAVYGNDVFERYLPTSLGWYIRLHKAISLSGKSLSIKILKLNELTELENLPYAQFTRDMHIPDILRESLYKSDPSRYNPRMRLYTRQDDIEEAIDFISTRNINMFEVVEKQSEFDWGNIPKLVQPEGGQLPEKRRERKCQQLSNLAAQVVKICEEKSKTSDISPDTPIRIVDFCSGGGHLGILLAWLLPKCQILLVENKEESLRRAEERVELLHLTNVSLYQSNLDYFVGQFEVGVALHACGTATDLVLQKCISAKASFVCCPCCYGAIQSNHMLHYPRSSTFQCSNISLRHYFILSHAADQTHDEKHEKTEQGNTCMRIIDTDRLLYAKENLYEVTLRRIVPETASPKNHILVGVYKS